MNRFLLVLICLQIFFSMYNTQSYLQNQILSNETGKQCYRGQYYYNQTCNYYCPQNTYAQLFEGYNYYVCVDKCSNNTYGYSSYQMCVHICPAGYYANNSTNTCELCNIQCQICEDSTNNNCAVCNSMFFNVNNSCVSSCPSGFFGFNSRCVQCDSPCQTCTNFGNNSCLSCQYNLFLQGSLCVQSCAQGTITNFINQTCQCPSGQQFNQNSICANTSSNNNSKAQMQKICESAEIPLDFIDLNESGGVCVVREMLNPTVNANDNWNGYTCNQSAFTGTDQFHDTQIPKSDACPTQLGVCNNQTGQCDGIPNGYYKQNFGRDWQGIGTWDTVTMTTYGGSAACLGDVQTAQDCVAAQMGLDGIAAVPPRMYGKWDVRSQTCVANNNVCYKITGPYGGSATVAIGGRCGGYGQCGPTSVLTPQDIVQGEPFDYGFLAYNLNRLPNTGWIDTNRCIYDPGCSIESGITPSCLVQSPPFGKSGESCCPGFCNIPNLQHIDWCIMNDHPHFDLSLNAFQKICNATTGACIAKYVEPIVCPQWQPDICIGQSIIKCPANSYQATFESSCSPSQQKLIQNGNYTECCCESGYLPNEDGTECVKQNNIQNNCSCQTYTNTTQWNSLCQLNCYNYTGCREQVTFCNWTNVLNFSCPANSFSPNSEVECIPNSAKLISDGSYTSCCCNEGYYASENGTYCIKQNVTSCDCTPYTNTTQWKSLCDLNCNNYTGCSAQETFCNWTGAQTPSNGKNNSNASQYNSSCLCYAQQEYIVWNSVCQSENLCNNQMNCKLDSYCQWNETAMFYQTSFYNNFIQTSKNLLENYIWKRFKKQQS